MAKSLNLNVENPLGLIDVSKLEGYTLCLNEIYGYIKEKTQFKPEKRHIDAVDLLETIIATSQEIRELNVRAEMELKEAFDELKPLI